MKKRDVDVCVVGGGPAGMLLALLLAHKGVKVLVLELHKDFAREYRGEVLMPRFTQMFQQLGLNDWLLTLTHLKLKYGEISYKGKAAGRIDFAAACSDAPYALWMPQPVLLNGLYEKAKAFPSFEMWFNAPVKHLILDGAVQGVHTAQNGEPVEVRARVVVGCDGRYSTVLKDGGFELEYHDHEFDILWFSIPKPKDYDNTFRVLLSPKRSYLLLPKYPDSIQVGILTSPKGVQEIKDIGLEAFRKELAEAHPAFKEFAASIKDFSIFHPLQAYLHLVKTWAKDGCLLIGDAAHCCSPAGAIGVSMAMGSAMLAADTIVKGLKNSSGPLPASLLGEVQKKYEPEIRTIHRIQTALTGGLLNRLLPVRWVLPLVLNVIARTPFFKKAQRALMALPRPVPIAADLAFRKGEV